MKLVDHEFFHRRKTPKNEARRKTDLDMEIIEEVTPEQALNIKKKTSDKRIEKIRGIR